MSKLNMKNQNKKAELEEFIKYLLWIIFFLIVGGALFFALKKITG